MAEKAAASCWFFEKPGLTEKTTKLSVPFLEGVGARIQDNCDIEAGFQICLAKTPGFPHKAAGQVPRDG